MNIRSKTLALAGLSGFALALATGCATSGDVDSLRNELRETRALAERSSREASEAAAKAEMAAQTADAAAAPAEAAAEKAEMSSKKTEEVFRQSLRK
jgi:murein lipoprotein